MIGINGNAELLDLKPPSDPIAEVNVLGTLVINPGLLDEHEISTEHFAEEANKIIFGDIAGLRESGIPIDAAHLYDSLKENGDLQHVGGAAALAEILRGNVLPARFPEYLSVLHEKAARRATVNMGIEAIKGAHSNKSTPALLSGLRDRVDAISGVTGSAVRFNRISAKELATSKFDIKFFIKGLLVAMQPQGWFGGKKTLKTTLMLDQACSLATAKPFLGYFHVEHKARVAVFSGESGMATIQETCRRICRAAGIDLAETGIVFYDTLPMFGSSPHMHAFERALVDDGIELVYIDPAYLAMATEGNEGSLFAMGSLLRSMSELCQRIGTTPVILHHMKKSVADQYTPGDLDDASWAGFAEFCRGWTLINRREKYEPGSGLHKLWMSVGGSVGHSGLWGLDIFEGVYDGPDSRTWEVTVHKADDVRQEAQDTQSEAKHARLEEKLTTTKRAILDAVVKLPERRGTKSDIRTRTGINGQLFNLAFAELINEGELDACTVTKGNKRDYEAYKLNGE